MWVLEKLIWWVGDLDLIGVNHQMSWETIVYMVSNIIINKSKNHVERKDFNDLLIELPLWVSLVSPWASV
jgi:hypothetical protein